MTVMRFQMPPKGALAPNGPYDPLPSYYAPVVGGLYRARIEKALSLLDNVSFRSVLEIGYGSGVLLPSLCGHTKDVTGVDRLSDPKTAGRCLAGLNCRPKLFRCEAQKMAFPAKRFDLIVSISTFEHIREAGLLKIRGIIGKILRPGGHLLLGLPAINLFMDRMLALIGYPGISDHHVTGPGRIRKIFSERMDLVRQSRLPAFLPDGLCLYYMYLFRKPEKTKAVFSVSR